MAAPSTWNRYAYVHGDPINFHDPGGLNEASPDGYCAAEYTYEECFGVGIGGGGGGGGGGGSFVGRGPDPNWQTGAQVKKNVDAWDALILAALVAGQARQQDEPGFRYVRELRVVDDCLKRQALGGSAVRRRTYQAVDQFGDPYAAAGLTISEHVHVQSGELTGLDSTWHVNNYGMFQDVLTKGAGPDTTEFQQFTASNVSGLNSFGSVSVMVYDPANPNGPYFGTLGITLRQHDVFINGSDGKIGGKPRYCDTPDM